MEVWFVLILAIALAFIARSVHAYNQVSTGRRKISGNKSAANRGDSGRNWWNGDGGGSDGGGGGE